VKGVTDVVWVPAGIAVLAHTFWSARNGRAALKIDWDESDAEGRGSDALFATYRALAQQPDARVRRDGDPDAAIAGTTRSS
jgi:isoquinoline 1-oxidoreductase subunit beta